MDIRRLIKLEQPSNYNEALNFYRQLKLVYHYLKETEYYDAHFKPLKDIDSNYLIDLKMAGKRFCNYFIQEEKRSVYREEDIKSLEAFDSSIPFIIFFDEEESKLSYAYKEIDPEMIHSVYLQLPDDMEAFRTVVKKQYLFIESFIKEQIPPLQLWNRRVLNSLDEFLKSSFIKRQEIPTVTYYHIIFILLKYYYRDIKNIKALSVMKEFLRHSKPDPAGLSALPRSQGFIDDFYKFNKLYKPRSEKVITTYFKDSNRLRIYEREKAEINDYYSKYLQAYWSELLEKPGEIAISFLKGLCHK